MPTPAEIIDMTASLMNDTAQTSYTDAACLPYLNMALDELQEYFELNNIPVTNKVSAVLNVLIGVNRIAFAGTTPLIPSDLIEIQELWESPETLNQWTRVGKREFIPHYLEDGTTISLFGIWAWDENEIKLIAADADIDLKIDYIASIFATPILIGAIATDLGVKLKNTKGFLGYRTAGLCAEFIGENPTRAAVLNNAADRALGRSLGISVKSMQSLNTRRRPFRASYKGRRIA